MKKTLLIAGCFFMTIIAYAQTDFQIRKATRVKGLVYSSERSILLEGKTNGFDVGYQWGKLNTYYRTTFYRITLGNTRHPKETRINPNGITVPTANSYFFGRRNAFFQLQGTWGQKRYFSEKDAIRGVAAGVSYAFGPILGILKPYYVQVSQSENPVATDKRYIKYSPDNAALFLNREKITGAAPFSYRIKETTLQPGFHANIGAHFDWGAYEDFVRAMEVGIAAQYFFRNLPLTIIQEDNRPLFINLYAHFQLGKRK